MRGNFNEGELVRSYITKRNYIDFDASTLINKAINSDFQRVKKTSKKRKYKNRAEQIESIKRDRHEVKINKMTPEEIICSQINQINDAKKKEK